MGRDDAGLRASPWEEVRDFYHYCDNYVDAIDRVLYVPQWDMAKAELAMRKAGVTGAVSNLCGTRRKVVKGGRR